MGGIRFVHRGPGHHLSQVTCTTSKLGRMRPLWLLASFEGLGEAGHRSAEDHLRVAGRPTWLAAAAAGVEEVVAWAIHNYD